MESMDSTFSSTSLVLNFQPWALNHSVCRLSMHREEYWAREIVHRHLLSTPLAPDQSLVPCEPYTAHAMQPLRSIWGGRAGKFSKWCSGDLGANPSSTRPIRITCPRTRCRSDLQVTDSLPWGLQWCLGVAITLSISFTNRLDDWQYLEQFQVGYSFLRIGQRKKNSSPIVRSNNSKKWPLSLEFHYEL